jgi:hypothetical protein
MPAAPKVLLLAAPPFPPGLEVIVVIVNVPVLTVVETPTPPTV